MPTENQKAAVKDTLELLGKGKRVSMGKILKKNGYSAAMAKNPKQVTESKGWQDLMEEFLPDNLLSKVHKEGLKATFTDKFNTKEPDYGVRHKYLETAYKVKGKVVEKSDITSDGKPIVFMPTEIIEKYKLNDISPSTEPNSEGQPPVQSD